MQDDRSYIGWCIKNLDYVIFDDEVLDELQLSEEYYRKNNENDYYYCYDDSDDDSYEYMRQELIDAGIWDWDDKKIKINYKLITIKKINNYGCNF